MITYTKAGIEAALNRFLTALSRRPDKDLRRAWAALRAGEHPACAPILIHRDPAPEDVSHPRDRLFLEEQLEQNLHGLLRRIELENPVAPVLDTGFGPATLATALSGDAAPDDTAGGLPIEAFDEADPPDLAAAGLLPRVRDQIEFFKENTPPEFTLAPPDLQGPFNIAHTLVGDPLFEHMERDPDRVHNLMDLVTETLLDAWTEIPGWIGAERLAPTPGLAFCPADLDGACYVAECSANRLTPARYEEFVLPYDRRMEEEFGPLAFHPCSGRRLFRVLAEHFPQMLYTEAGWIANLEEEAIGVDEALTLIPGTAVLVVREDLPAGREAARLEELVGLMHRRPGLYLSVTGLGWGPADDEAIRALHRRIDARYHGSDA
ncbi:MAG: hypothetical protein JW951_03360 [Lentisphaerae bacterium]|nr:hypothetical protein [Lentisphaerota bacterium]